MADDTVIRARELVDEERQKDLVTFRHAGRRRRAAILAVGLALYLAVLSGALAAPLWLMITIFVAAISTNELLTFLARRGRPVT